MATKSPTFHVQLFPTFPPASNALEAQQRSFHRLRSTRKLEAIRGTTPPFLNLASKVDIMLDTQTPISPGTRATRRKGQVFNSPSSPMSSTDSIESNYVFINTRVRSDLQPHSPSSCSPSPAGNPVTNDNYSGSGISGEVKTGNTNKKTEGPQPLAQPFLLQFRSRPVPTTSSIKAKNLPVHHPEPLSPISSSTFNMSSTPTSPHPRHVLTENEKRKKLAKLARTLGENIPPELVFHSSPTLGRSASMFTPGPSPRSHKLSHSLAVSTSPLSSVAPPAAPTPKPQRSTEKPTTSVEEQRTGRPQSMTLATESPTPSIRGTSLDHISANNLNDLPFQELIVPVPESTKRPDTPPQEWGRRKEREWSGEWNVKDMNHVTKALRGLKAR